MTLLEDRLESYLVRKCRALESQNQTRAYRLLLDFIYHDKNVANLAERKDSRCKILPFWNNMKIKRAHSSSFQNILVMTNVVEFRVR